MKPVGSLLALAVLAFGTHLCLATQIGPQQMKATVNQTKQARSSFNNNEAHYSNAGQQVWNPSNRFELASIVPTAIVFLGLVLLVIPLCLSLFTPFFFGGAAPYASNPWYGGSAGGYHGRRKRDISAELNRKAKSLGLIERDLNFDALLPSASTMLETVITSLGRSLQEKKM